MNASQVASVYSSTVSTYVNTTQPTEMKIQLIASNYSGVGTWSNSGTLGSSFSASIQTGTPSTNSVGNGVVFNRNLVYRFPSIGMVPNWTLTLWMKRTGLSGTMFSQQYTGASSLSPRIEGTAGRNFYGQHYYNNGYYSGGQVSLDVDTWYHVGYVWCGFQMFAYLDG